jgi:hypothetical protein
MPKIFFVGKYRIGIDKTPITAGTNLALHSLTPNKFNVLADSITERGIQFLVGGTFWRMTPKLP